MYHMKRHLEREHGEDALKRVKDLDTILKRADRYLWIFLSVTAEEYSQVQQASEKRNRGVRGDVEARRRGVPDACR